MEEGWGMGEEGETYTQVLTDLAALVTRMEPQKQPIPDPGNDGMH